MTGTAFETLLWTLIANNPSLHAVSLFVVATCTNLVGLGGRQGPDNPCTLVLRGQALRCMQKGWEPPPTTLTENVSSPFVISLSVLAGWEKVYGDEEFYNTHLKALQSVEMQDGRRYSPKDRIVCLMESVIRTTQRQVDGLPTSISSDGTLSIPKHLDQICTRPASPHTAFEPDMFNHDRPHTRSLLFILTRLADYNLLGKNAWSAMYELSLLTLAWRAGRKPPSSWVLQRKPDDLEDLALYHVRTAMVSILGAWTYAVAVTTNADGYFRASDSMDVHYEDMLSLQSEHLMGTKYEEALLWSVFMITATATPSIRKSRSLSLIDRLLSSRRLRIESFAALECVLRKYAYRESVYRTMCTALYDSVVARDQPTDAYGLRQLNITLADLVL